MYGQKCAASNMASAPGRLLASGMAATLLVSGLIGGGAVAQESASQGGQNQLEVIVVTATKAAASQDVSKVPISITAFDGRTIDSLNAKDLAALIAITPGVDLTQTQLFGAPLTNIQIRGVQSRTSEPTTGMYLDDTPITTIGHNTNLGGAVAMPVVFDLQRVEVLRGPQGTLFGSTSEGGAIRLIPNAPSLTDYSHYTRTEGATTAHGDPTYEIGYAAGGPISEDKLGFRFSAWYRKDGGWIDHCQPAVAVAGCAYVLEKNANWNTTEAIRGALLWVPNDRLTVEPSLSVQRFSANDPAGYELLASDPDNGIWNADHSTDLSSEDPLTIASVRLTWDLNKVVATSVTSWVKRDYDFHTDYTEYQDWAFFRNPYPLTGEADDFGLGDYFMGQRTATEEFRFASVDSGSRLSWVAGVFYSNAKQHDFAHVIHPNLPDLVLANYGVPIDQVLGVPFYLGMWVAYNEVHTDSEQLALFGTVDFQINDKFRLTLAGRSTHYEQHVTSFIAGPFNGGTQFFEADASGSPFTPKVSLSFQATDNTMYYVTTAKGFRIGGVNPQIDNAQPACQAAKVNYIAQGLVFDHQFDPDSLWSYEVGVKTRLADNRISIDASAYHVDWKDIQNPLQIAGCGFTEIFNLGEAKANGFDVGLQALLGEHVRLDAAIGRTSANYVSNVTGLVSAGDEITAPGFAVPPWTSTLGFEFRFRAGNHDAYAWIQHVYHSKNDGKFNTQTPTNATYNPLLAVNPQTRMVNLRLGLRLPVVDVSIFANNVTDEHPVLSVGDAFYPDPRLTAVTWRPRTIGLNATFRY